MNKYKKRIFIQMWKDRGVYYEHTAPQGTDEWIKARIGRCNGSDSGGLAGESNFDTPEQVGKYIAGVEKKDLSGNQAVQHGHKTEPISRAWYEKTYNCKVIERGYCIPKDSGIIGASVDGDIVDSEGIIEIKCPVSMYRPILKYMEMKENGWIPPERYLDHIWKTHYCQMQQGMFVLKKKYCDYIVYSTEDKKAFVQRVWFDPEFWEQHYAKLEKNYELYVRPYL